MKLLTKAQLARRDDILCGKLLHMVRLGIVCTCPDRHAKRGFLVHKNECPVAEALDSSRVEACRDNPAEIV